jgi:putative ABC transport system permease protein
MTTSVRSRAAGTSRISGGAPARRAVVRWAWRLFRREWRQQLAVIGLLTLSVATATFAIAFAADAAPSPSAQFGTANHMLTSSGSPARQAVAIAATARFGSVEVIKNAKAAIAGSVNTVDVRAEQPGGRYSSPMLRLDAGHYPSAGQVAVTAGVAAIYRLSIGSVWHEGATALRVVGIVENPANLQDEFALVAPGQLPHVDSVTVLLDATYRQLSAVRLPAGAKLSTRPSNSPGFPPAAVLVFDTIALLFVGLIAVAGFTVLAQRRLRAFGMLQAVGATDRHVRLVLLANGAVVGLIAGIAGAVVGLAGWVALVPRLETVVEHRMNALSLPWWEIVTAAALAVLTAIAAAWWPARAAARVPPVVALSGRPTGPKQGRRSAALGVALLGVGLVAIAWSRQGKTPPLIIGGLVLTAAGVLLFGPIAVGGLAAVAGRSPVAVRIAVRDLGRYRTRSGAALAAIVLVTGIVAAIAISAAASAVNEGSPGEVGWTNLPASQLIVYVSPGGAGQLPEVIPPLSGAQLVRDHRNASHIAAAVHAQHLLPLYGAVAGGAQPLPEGPATDAAELTGYLTANLASPVNGPNGHHGLELVGQLYVATRALLSFYGVRASAVRATTEIITSRSSLTGAKTLDSGPLAVRCRTGHVTCLYQGQKVRSGTRIPFSFRGGISPTFQVLGLPRYTSAPNTLLTAHGMTVLGLHPLLAGWLIQAPKALTAAQVIHADQWAARNGLTVETTKFSPQASLSSVSNDALGIGVLAVLAVLAMTVGLIRSEAASDLRVLAASGAGEGTRRLLTGATAAALALLGALLGTAAAYLGIIAWNRGVHDLSAVPVAKLAMLVGGLPLLALAAAWLLAGREPAAMAGQPLD